MTGRHRYGRVFSGISPLLPMHVPVFQDVGLRSGALSQICAGRMSTSLILEEHAFTVSVA